VGIKVDPTAATATAAAAAETFKPTQQVYSGHT
jgi:hypothetical protein